MGKRLANEVENFIFEWCPNNSLGRLSFIGHSLGGVIIRAALPYLANYYSKFYTFLTLSSPHLGYMYSSNSLFDAGIYIFLNLFLFKIRYVGVKKMEKKCMFKAIIIN